MKCIQMWCSVKKIEAMSEKLGKFIILNKGAIKFYSPGTMFVAKFYYKNTCVFECNDLSTFQSNGGETLVLTIENYA